MKSNIIRAMEFPPTRLLPSHRAKGVVEQISVDMADDGHHVEITQTLWTRNRRTKDERGDVINQKVLVRLTAQEAAALASDLAWTLIHVDSRGPKDASAPSQL